MDPKKSNGLEQQSQAQEQLEQGVEETYKQVLDSYITGTAKEGQFE